MWRANTTTKFTVNTQMNRNVGLLRLFPGITADTVRLCGNVCLYLPHTIDKSLHSEHERVHYHIYSLIRSGPSCSLLWTGSYWRPTAAVMLLLDEIRKATDRGVIMINCTQCLRGSVTTSYATGQVWVFA